MKLKIINPVPGSVLRAAIYSRVSTDRAECKNCKKTFNSELPACPKCGSANMTKQETENQAVVLRELCQRLGWEIVIEYADHASGSKSDRDDFQQVFQDARVRKWDVLLFWALDRFSREGVAKTFEHLKRLDDYGVRWRSYTEEFLDTTNAFREPLIAIMAWIAQQERNRIRQRVRAGLDRARREGKILGGRRKIFDRQAVSDFYHDPQTAGYHSVRKTADHFGLKKDTVSRAIKERT